MTGLRAAAVLLAAAVFGAATLAQNVDELQKQLSEMKASMEKQARVVEAQGRAIQKLEDENTALKTGAGARETELEAEVNRMSERLGAGTNIRSCASAIKLGGEFRFRGTVAALDSPDPAIEDGYWVDARVRLSFQYDFGCDVTAFAELQSHWAFGEGTLGPFHGWEQVRPLDTPGSVGMYQAWLEFRNIFCHRELSARVGRQEFVKGDQFQFGNADWYNGIVHDGLRVDWNARCWSLTTFWAKLTTLDKDRDQIPSYTNFQGADTHDDAELYTAYFTLKAIKCTTIDLYWAYINGESSGALNSGASPLNLGFALYPLDNAYFHTFGARVAGRFNVACGLDYNVEGAFQTGTTHNDVARLDTDGVSAEAEVGLTLTKSSKFRVFARALYAEGPDADSAGYLILYPNRHMNGGFRARYGLADLMPMTNVESIQLGLHFDPTCNWTVGATGLYGRADRGLVPGQSKDYGEEVDVWAEYRYSQQITLGAGAALVFPDDSGMTLWNLSDDTQFVGYIQARLIF